MIAADQGTPVFRVLQILGLTEIAEVVPTLEVALKLVGVEPLPTGPGKSVWATLAHV